PHDDIVKKTFFDLASLTKPLVTTLAVLSLLPKNRIRIEDNLEVLLEKELDREYKEITLFHLLNHCSGLPAYRPFYRKDLGEHPEERKKNIVREIVSCPLPYRPGQKEEYSDLGFILLGRIVEIKSGGSLDRYFAENILAPLGTAKTLFFNPLERISKINPLKYAATEICPWRQRLIQGEVHDENTFYTGGVSGQAGLFGDAAGVLDLAGVILEMWKGRWHHPRIRNQDLQYFLKVPGMVKDSSRALGFDTPAPEGSSAGRLLSPKSVGHLGFTGTSFWIDPERELIIVLLTNRIHPSRENNKIREFRPFFHDEITRGVK
ncbi:MAG: serine hydrolase domain-containing protein, partial [Thermodesulfobacteriota bacterium]